MTRPWTLLRFRSSPALELKRIDDLPSEQQTALAELRQDADFYGVLVPRGGGGLKSVGRATAALLLSVREPATLRGDDQSWWNDIADLVLDGILEIEHEGRFLSGADAFHVLECGSTAAALGTGLHAQALHHAAALATSDPAQLTAALYAYNRLPRTRAWAARFPDREHVLAHLGESALLDRHWHRLPSNNGWISWQSRAPRPVGSTDVTWKLYVSPRPEQIRDAFHATVRVLAGIDGAPMKIGSDAAGLLRPDKLVAYFHSKEEVERAAKELAARLHGCPAHGVPFTAMFDESGLLSWGADPPDSERALRWLDRESWRLFVAKTLASAMSIAKRRAGFSLPGNITAGEFAVERAHRHGIDVRTWAPSDALWSGAA